MEIDFKVIKIVERIAYLALMMNQKHQNTVFFSFSGHVNWFSISIYLDGWKEGIRPDFEEQISFELDDDAYERLINVAKYLKKIGFEDEEEYVEADDEDFDIFQLIDEEKDLDHYCETSNDDEEYGNIEEEEKKIC